jgi:hypothetical protein
MQQESRFRDMRYRDPIVAIEISSYLDRWFNSVLEFRESKYEETKETK